MLTFKARVTDKLTNENQLDDVCVRAWIVALRALHFYFLFSFSCARSSHSHIYSFRIRIGIWKHANTSLLSVALNLFFFLFLSLSSWFLSAQMNLWFLLREQKFNTISNFIWYFVSYFVWTRSNNTHRLKSMQIMIECIIFRWICIPKFFHCITVTKC